MTEMTDTVPKSLRELITEWMTDNPGWHLGSTIVAGVANISPPRPRLYEGLYEELGRMARAGLVARWRTPPPGRTSVRTFYMLTVDVTDSMH